jgi:hypothetical protein
MARRQLLVLALSGYVAALLPYLWARYDMRRIPRSIWRYAASPRPREVWKTGLTISYVCGGWPALLVAFGWRFSRDRSALREEWAHLHRRNVESSRRAPPAPPPAAGPGPEPEIVLADYEDDDEPEERREDHPRPEDAPPAPGG